MAAFINASAARAAYIVGTIKTLRSNRLSVEVEAGSSNTFPGECEERKSKRADVALSQNDLPTKDEN
jgi:hypothetical protein